MMFYSKFKRAASQHENAVPLVIVNHTAVVELSCPEPKGIVDVRGHEQKSAILEKSANEVAIISWNFSKN
jgi:hypothetical protein